MKKIILIALFFMHSAQAEDTEKASQAALKFNKWYIGQVAKDHFPITDNPEIDKYVTADTMKKLRHAQDPRFADDEFYDADFFLKSQDIGDDWVGNVSVVASEYDPVCTNIYVTFGAKEDNTVVDCMVEEKGVWKVQSVAREKISRNEVLK